MSDPHDAQALTGFLEAELQVGPHTLRPLSAGSLAVLQSVGNAFFSGGDGDDPPGAADDEGQSLDEETLNALCEYIFCHAMEPRTVVKLAKEPAAFREEAQAFCFEVSMQDFAAFLTDMGRIQEAAASAIVETIDEEDDGPGKHPQSPTGSPACSTPSVLPEIPSGRTTSSGDSRSADPSSMSTLPTVSTAPDAGSSTDAVPGSHPLAQHSTS